MPGQTHTFDAELWLYPTAKAAWCFATLPRDVGEQFKFFHPHTGGFGSIKVTAKIGDTEWTTSIFPDSRSGSYLLPVKAEVRKKERVKPGDVVSVTIASRQAA